MIDRRSVLLAVAASTMIASVGAANAAEWKAKYPDCIYSDSKKSDQYNHIVIEAMGGSGDNDAEKVDKIVKKIAKVVTIDKNA